jgi:hypothetical protein
LSIGATVGLNMTPAVARQLIGWVPIMLGTALVMILASAVFSVILARLARLDSTTAFFASLPGGMAEMGNVGAQSGAHPEPIAIVQLLRVAMIVVLVPPLLAALDVLITAAPPAAPLIPAPEVLLLVLGGGAMALVLRLLRLNNPWTIGGIVWAGIMTANELVDGRMPPVVFLMAQLLIGYSIGTQFRLSMIRTLPRVTAAGVVTITGLAAFMVGFSVLLSGATELDLLTAILATSPGGMSEMAATAQALHLGVALVVAFQVVRAVLVNGFATHYWRLLSRTGFLSALEMWIGGKGRGSGKTD